MQGRRALIASCALIGLTFFATSSSAECAWVLWERQAKEPGLLGWWNGATWAPRSAYGTKQECEDPLDILTKGKPRKFKLPDRTEVTVTENDPLDIRRGLKEGTWRCLPDTIDPRGPRAK